MLIRSGFKREKKCGWRGNAEGLGGYGVVFGSAGNALEESELFEEKGAYQRQGGCSQQPLCSASFHWGSAPAAPAAIPTATSGACHSAVVGGIQRFVWCVVTPVAAPLADVSSTGPSVEGL